MRIRVLAGYAEYLLPRPVDMGDLQPILGRAQAGALIPPARWCDASEDMPYHHFLFGELEDEDAPSFDERVEMFLEYAEDLAGPADTIYTVLPYDSFVAAGCVEAALVDTRVRRVVDAARARFGAEAVDVQRLILSANTQAVFERLHARAAAASPPNDEGGGWQKPLVVMDHVTGDAPEAMCRNYSRAVMRLAFEVLAEQSLFGGRERVNVLATAMENNRLYVRPDVTPDRVLESLEPGGVLHDLLFNPVVGLGAPPAPPPVDELQD